VLKIQPSLITTITTRCRTRQQPLDLIIHARQRVESFATISMPPAKRQQDVPTASESTTPKRQRVVKQKSAIPIKAEKPDPKVLAQSPTAHQKTHVDPSLLDSLNCITPDAGQLAHPEAMKLFSEVKVNIDNKSSLTIRILRIYMSHPSFFGVHCLPFNAASLTLPLPVVSGQQSDGASSRKPSKTTTPKTLQSPPGNLRKLRCFGTLRTNLLHGRMNGSPAQLDELIATGPHIRSMHHPHTWTNREVTKTQDTTVRA